MSPPTPGISALVVHWTAVPKQGALDVIAWWNNGAVERQRYGSTHAIADDGNLYQTVPYDERAYHVGSEHGYSRFATDRFGAKATSSTGSPNRFCWGIEMCVENSEGECTPKTWQTTVDWLAMMARTMDMDPFRDVLTHQQIVGWKQCPKWLVNHPDELERMRRDVARAL